MLDRLAALASRNRRLKQATSRVACRPASLLKPLQTGQQAGISELAGCFHDQIANLRLAQATRGLVSRFADHDAHAGVDVDIGVRSPRSHERSEHLLSRGRRGLRCRCGANGPWSFRHVSSALFRARTLTSGSRYFRTACDREVGLLASYRKVDHSCLVGADEPPERNRDSHRCGW